MSTSPKARTFFVALRISNPQIYDCIKKIQDSIAAHDQNLKGRPLAKLHVTPMFMYLEGAEEIAKAERILLNQCKTALEPVFSKRPTTLRFKGLDHFSDAHPPVIYANLEQEGRDFLKLVNKTVSEIFTKEGIPPKDSPEFIPHMTVMKSKRYNGEISNESYKSFVECCMGEQPLTKLTLHLCPANGETEADGLYKCMATMTLGDPDETYSS